MIYAKIVMAYYIYVYVYIHMYNISYRVLWFMFCDMMMVIKYHNYYNSPFLPEVEF